MDWFLYDNGLRHERVNQWAGFYLIGTFMKELKEYCA